MATITVSMIGKNEEDNLSRCIKSVKGIARNIVYADTGSTDTSVNIAESLGCHIRHVPFDDFAQARNLAKEGLTGDWILQIDADEVLFNPEGLLPLVESNYYEAYVLAQEHLILGGNKTAMGMRLFRNRPHYQYVGCIHEMPEDMKAIGPDKAISPYMFVQDVCFAHYGCVDERLRRTKVSDRNLRLLIKDLQDNPGRGYNKYLMIRDYLNIYKWRTEANGFRCKFGSVEHLLLSAIVRDYEKYKNDILTRHRDLAKEVLESAQSVLAQQDYQYIEGDMDPVTLLSLGIVMTNKGD
jgi:glycosyltransferase involved in cell wall biosynthesis